MCQIDFTISYNDPDGDNLQAGQGRYRIHGTDTTWTTFTINLSNPQTPDITVIEDYDLEVRVQDVNGAWSNWFSAGQGVSDIGFKIAFNDEC